ncbi:hypothetical protein [Pinibacter aurantiacus]|uniref:Uncharacterized protein n=1 Tax=Pinibacter aurantiacus TaxID=2851599 RepID=A0A9E2S9U7_9BACT|nr:hypothetical protein [Pinibacter aurantiacus]MBV4359091.1 hypothetical protein [Pinibacter aurantiacus]
MLHCSFSILRFPFEADRYGPLADDAHLLLSPAFFLSAGKHPTEYVNKNNVD